MNVYKPTNILVAYTDNGWHVTWDAVPTAKGKCIKRFGNHMWAEKRARRFAEKMAGFDGKDRA